MQCYFSYLSLSFLTKAILFHIQGYLFSYSILSFFMFNVILHIQGLCDLSKVMLPIKE